MSPSRTRKTFVPARPRAEVITAVVVAAGIVLGTALLVWLMRPGTHGVPGTGGLLSRQPRMTLLVLIAAAAFGLFLWWILRRPSEPRFGTRGAVAIGTAVVVVLAVIGGVFWPGGAVRHWPKQPKFTPVPTTLPTVATTTTKPASGTTTTTRTNGGSTTSVAPTSTVAPSTPTTKAR